MAKFITQKRGISCYEGDKLNILGVETSCDETAAAVCTNGSILSNIILYVADLKFFTPTISTERFLVQFISVSYTHQNLPTNREV